VPNATVMLIEGANRFGLAQLHQFRGRVGRGDAQSYCILLSDTSRVTEDNPRLSAIEQTNDGFKLAEIDLEIRGMGEFFGTRQSGMPDLRVARLSDLAILEQAREQARALFERDPDLALPEQQPLAQRVARFWQQPTREGDVS
jgi:ATP-dependent DNA helicase RecG